MADQSSIFDKSFMQGQPPKKKPSAPKSERLKTNQMAPLPAYAQAKPADKEDKPLDVGTMTVSDVYRMIEKYRKMHDQVERQLDDIYQKSGFTPKQIENFLGNPNNFTNSQWDYLQKRQQEFEVSFQVKKEGEVTPLKVMKNSQDQEIKARRGKTIGRRRNWIEVR